ncbi:zona pellucida protein AX 4 [Limanda limanda]|uniref:zona pellucida protein AX 4 n=1 Tax=Limanda limanda TaxID=27771 RepID=UPI0029C71F91|nr:zona pellucida protein AX 4 [Limanda limanda]
MALLLSGLLPAKSDDIPDGAHSTECRDCYFVMAVDVAFTGEELHFEAVDETGVYPITQKYSAECGYTVSVLPRTGQVELRASYFSCHTDNKVSVSSEVACPSGETTDDWNAEKHAPAASDWQVMFHTAEEQLQPMNLSEAREQGYMIDLTDRRIVFRTPYGQPHSSSLEVNGVPVEVVHATLFSKQSWVFIIVDLMATCSMHEGSYDDAGYMVWETPELLNPLVSGLNNTQINIDVGGELVQQSVAEEMGFIVEEHDGKVEISIPYNAEGGYRKSFVSGGLNEFYVFHLYLEQIFVNKDQEETRVKYHRTLASPMLPLEVFTVNQTVVEEHTFTIYLGDIPDDIELSAVELNGHKCDAPFTNTSGHTVIEVFHPNNTHGYTLTVPFDDPVVLHQFSKEDEAMKHILEVNYTLTVLPENEPYFHLTSVMALSDIAPPEFDAVCAESGIIFKLEHRPFDYLWHISIGSDLLTPELATQQGYILTNDSQTLLLEVPLFTPGYVYRDFSLKGFIGTFEILVKDRETSEVLRSAVKTCPFTATEFIVCSSNGKMTVVADLSLAGPSGGIPATSNLLKTFCEPKEADDTRALFSFPLNSCGSTVKLVKEKVTYQNEIFYSKRHSSDSQVASEPITERLIVQCVYPLAGLHRLFSVHKFESDTPGVGKIIRTSQSSTEFQQTTTVKPSTEHRTTLAARRTTRALAVFHPTARYIRDLKELYKPN